MTKFFKNKKTVMATSLIIGVLMFSVPTFADMASKSGYDKFKDSIKVTADGLLDNADNYTSEISVSVKDNDKVVASSSTISKIDNEKDAIATDETTFEKGVEKKKYNYRDTKLAISLGEDNIYHISEYEFPVGYNASPGNPFNDKNATDVEKIIDAAVAGLKDNVTATVNADGSKAFSGSISENQVPALINTVSSYFFKTQFVGNSYRSNQTGLPELTNDIYIKNVEGKASANKDGILENVFVVGTLSGKEKDGTNHDLTVEILIDVSDVNKTVVSQPDLTDKKVEKNVVQNRPLVTDASMYVGSYKNDIVIRENGKFVKIGERNVVIAHGDSKSIEGRYYDEYLGDYGKNKTPVSFTFSANIQEANKGAAEFTYTNSEGKTDTGDRKSVV